MDNPPFFIEKQSQLETFTIVRISQPCSKKLEEIPTIFPLYHHYIYICILLLLYSIVIIIIIIINKTNYYYVLLRIIIIVYIYWLVVSTPSEKD